MAEKVKIEFHIRPIEITLPFTFKQEIQLKMPPQKEEMVLGVRDFPSFIKASLQANTCLVRDSMGLNLLSQRLIIDTDPLPVSNMDTMTLNELDINQNINYHSI